MNHKPNDSVTLDSETRDRISKELRKNFLVEAAAGTGKTTKIIDRMVNLVAMGECEIDHLVAVTFTRKAAAELRVRFEAGLRAGAHGTGKEFNAAARQRMLDACNRSNQAFVGTIHSFCASLLRERPIEFDVDPQFRELTETDDKLLKDSAWHNSIKDLIATDSPLLDRMSELGIVRNQLKHCFQQIIANRDIEQWPASQPQPPDLQHIRQEMQAYIDHMQTLAPAFPNERGNDVLMDRYEEIIRASHRDWTHPAAMIRMLEKFDASRNVVQSAWISKPIGKAEKAKWEDFRESVAKPALSYWYAKRYPLVIDFVTRAVALYEREKRSHGGLDFTDIILRVVCGLRAQPELRAYFQARYTHILVDEFQDTDPVQAEMLMLLCSEDHSQRDWNLCKLRLGSLFLVGDPKQAIYRFRRGDIVTYNRMRDLIKQSGEVLPLIKNFRSQARLIEWNNEVYRNLFGLKATAYSPASEDMLFGREEDPATTNSSSALSLSGLFTLPVVKTRNSVDTEGEADAIARMIRNAIDGGATIPRSKAEVQAGKTNAVEPRDFLIIPPRRTNIPTYKAALDRYGIPCDVTGGNAADGIEELKLLTIVLRCVDDPYDRISFLTLLRNHLFGFDDQELYELKQLGVSFTYSMPLDTTIAGIQVVQRYAAVCERLSGYARWLRSLPYTVGVTRIAEDLGLLAQACAREDGNIAAGGFLKAIEWLRQRSNDFDSVADVVGSLDELLEADEFEGGTALSPNTNEVRLMNLHKAKGLEAPVVFLCDTGNESSFPVHAHIDRSNGNRTDEARGFLSVQQEMKHQWVRPTFKPIACPVEWPPLEKEEEQFLAAEKDRLLYVATTRAGCALIVSTGNDKSVWGKLYPHLNDAPQLQVPKPTNTTQQSNSTQQETSQPLELQFATSATIADRWQNACLESYTISSAKTVGLKGVKRPKWETTGEYGYRWGSAVHELLEIRTKSPDANLRGSAINLAHEYGLAHDRIDELISAAESVTRSNIWGRAQAAVRCYSELPFETLITHAELPTLVRGVIDLIFEEPSGWVIVDYKTDDITESDIPEAIGYYRSQLQEYAKHWTAITGSSIKELGLYFTRLNCYEVVP